MYNDYIFVRRLKEDNKEGITYASATDDFIFRGEVVKIPEHYVNFQNSCKAQMETNHVHDYYTPPYPRVGSIVLFVKGAGEDVEYNGEHYKCVKFEDIIMDLDGE